MTELNMTNRHWGESSEVRATRLKKLGLFKPFKAERSRLMDTGMNERKAYVAMESQYGPDITEASQKLVAEAAERSSGPPNQEDLNWVYHNVADASIGPLDAPSSGAYGLWQKCQGANGGKAYDWVLNHIAPKTFANEYDNVDDMMYDLTGLREDTLGEFRESGTTKVQ